MLATSKILVIAYAVFAAGGECTDGAKQFLQQSYEEFDQSNDGWRPVADRKCYTRAAEIIEEYIEVNAGDMRAKGEIRILYWHAGQMRAASGNYPAAIQHFEAAYPPEEARAEMHLKTDAILAFLRRDRQKLQQIHDELSAMPEPEYFTNAMKEISERDPDARLPEWPLGMRSLNKYIACFDKPYVVAYLSDQCDSN